MPTPGPQAFRNETPIRILLRPAYLRTRPLVLPVLLVPAVLERLEGILLVVSCELAG